MDRNSAYELSFTLSRSDIHRTIEDVFGDLKHLFPKFTPKMTPNRFFGQKRPRHFRHLSFDQKYRQTQALAPNSPNRPTELPGDQRTSSGGGCYRTELNSAGESTDFGSTIIRAKKEEVDEKKGIPPLEKSTTLKRSKPQ